MDDREFLSLECSCGGLHHTIGITYYKWNPGDPDEPEIYIETLHRPDYGFWHRLWTAIKYVARKHPISYDSTLIGPVSALQLAEYCRDYALEYSRWKDALTTGVKEP